MIMEDRERRENIPVLTSILVVVNVLAFAFTEVSGSSLDAEHMIRMGAMYEPVFAEGHEYYRIITSFFLHFGLVHLVNNMISLLVLGYSLEQAIGKGWFGFIYMVSGVFSGLTSLWYHLHTGQEVVSCGASGAIFGLMGALMVLLVVHGGSDWRRRLPRFALYIALSLYSGMQDTGIDNAAHIGGFVGGLILCGIMCIVKRKGQNGGRA